MSHRTLAIALALLGAAGPWAEAATIFRCGHEYADVACPGGTAVDAPPAPTAQQRTEARQVALSEKLLAAEMTRDRREQEAALRPAVASSLGPVRPPAAAASAVKAKHSPKHRKSALPDDDQRDFIAAVPKAKKAPG